MELKKKESNVEIKIRTLDSDKDSTLRAYRFNSSLNTDYLIRVIKTIVDDYCGNIKNEIRFQDLINNKSFSFTTTSNKTNVELLEIIKNKVHTYKDVWDLQKTRYKLVVTNHESTENDRKQMSFHSKLSFDAVLEVVKKNCEKMIAKETEENIVFLDKKENKFSHSVTLCFEDKQSSFGICLKNYSSKEILELI